MMGLREKGQQLRQLIFPRQIFNLYNVLSFGKNITDHNLHNEI